MISSVLDAFVLRPLPFPEGNRLVSIWMRIDSDVSRGLRYRPKPSLIDLLRESSRTVEITPYTDEDLSLATAGDPPVRISGAKVGGGFFQVLGVEAEIGRVLEPADEIEERPVTVLSSQLAARLFPAAASALGATVRLEGSPHEVVGILPARAHFPSEVEAWIPIRRRDWAGPLGYSVVGRLRDGVAFAEARAEIRRIGERVPELEPEFSEGGLDAQGLQAALRRRLGPLLGALAAAVGLLLAIAGTNVLALAIGRATRCRTDRRIQSLLGSTRRGLFLDALLESAILCGAGAVAGIALAAWSLPLLAARSPLPFWSFSPFSVDTRVVLVFLCAASFLAALMAALTFGTEAPTRAARTTRSRPLAPSSLLVVVNTAITVTLLVVSGLTAETVDSLSRIDPGFSVDQVQVASVSAPPARSTVHRDRARFFREVVERFGALPSIDGVGGMHALPLDGASWYLRLRPEGGAVDADGELCLFRAVVPGTFDTLGVEILAGRDVRATDDAESPTVAVVNRSFVDRFLGDGRSPEEAIGVRFQAEDLGPSAPWTTIVGVVENTVETSLDVRGEPSLFLAHAQRDRRNLATMHLLLKHEGPPIARSTLQEALSAVDPDATLIATEPLGSVVDRSFAGQRSARLLVSLFAALALIQATAGIYGMARFQASCRREELGVRLALGAEPGSIRRREMWAALGRASAGLLLGSSLGWLLGTRLEDLWVGASVSDPSLHASVAALVVAVVLAATWGPTLRASKTDPTEILRAPTSVL